MPTKMTDTFIREHQTRTAAVYRILHEAKDASGKRYTVSEACAIVGITRKQYYYWLGRSEEAIEEMRRTCQELGRIELAEIMVTQQDITDQLINPALAKFTDPLDRLAIKRYLDDRLEFLSGRFQTRGGDAARDFLNGPKLTHVESKFGDTPTLESSNSIYPVAEICSDRTKEEKR